jgi:hypothetical protein
MSLAEKIFAKFLQLVNKAIITPMKPGLSSMRGTFCLSNERLEVQKATLAGLSCRRSLGTT